MLRYCFCVATATQDIIVIIKLSVSSRELHRGWEINEQDFLRTIGYNPSQLRLAYLQGIAVLYSTLDGENMSGLVIYYAQCTINSLSVIRITRGSIAY